MCNCKAPMKNFRLLLFLLVFLSISCSNSTKTLNFTTFTIEVPKSWNPVRENGIDSQVGRIAIDDLDTLSFDLGWYSNDLSEEYSRDYDKPGVEKLLKNSTTFEIIDSKKAKIVTPKKTGLGTTGVYFDSLWSAGASADRFQLNGKNLKPENEKLLLKALRTIKFFHKK
jgi:hypothetical protein